jgi:hypothetical protein
LSGLESLLLLVAAALMTLIVVVVLLLLRRAMAMDSSRNHCGFRPLEVGSPMEDVPQVEEAWNCDRRSAPPKKLFGPPGSYPVRRPECP